MPRSARHASRTESAEPDTLANDTASAGSGNRAPSRRSRLGGRGPELADSTAETDDNSRHGQAPRRSARHGKASLAPDEPRVESSTGNGLMPRRSSRMSNSALFKRPVEPAEPPVKIRYPNRGPHHCSRCGDTGHHSNSRKCPGLRPQESTTSADVNIETGAKTPAEPASTSASAADNEPPSSAADNEPAAESSTEPAATSSAPDREQEPAPTQPSFRPSRSTAREASSRKRPAQSDAEGEDGSNARAKRAATDSRSRGPEADAEPEGVEVVLERKASAASGGRVANGAQESAESEEERAEKARQAKGAPAAGLAAGIASHFGGMLTAEEADQSKTTPNEADRLRFRLAKEKAEPPKTKDRPEPADGCEEEEAFVLPDPPAKIESIHFGDFIIDTWYTAPYPEEYAQEGTTGSPEKPLSDLGLLSYRSYWKTAVFTRMLTFKNADEVSVDGTTGMTADDVISTLEINGILRQVPEDELPPDDTSATADAAADRRPPSASSPDRRRPRSRYKLVVDRAAVSAWVRKQEAKGYIKVDPERLRWSPYIAHGAAAAQPPSPQPPPPPPPSTAAARARVGGTPRGRRDAGRGRIGVLSRRRPRAPSSERGAPGPPFAAAAANCDPRC
ncbi:MAG: hypothetical protein BJ554DRAFT_7156 [Olpidium bornovanus]|uniref:Histone acetyltransferase n=1 Tax=Olpidium bornovanus TaxID=278681 RepID=A0A8H7ZWM5_9FUNG|nr:MAG: hypothetical protein BJ554DRAFT_7156 [Olpidium bornovanus]